MGEELSVLSGLGHLEEKEEVCPFSSLGKYPIFLMENLENANSQDK